MYEFPPPFPATGRSSPAEAGIERIYWQSVESKSLVSVWHAGGSALPRGEYGATQRVRTTNPGQR